MAARLHLLCHAATAATREFRFATGDELVEPDALPRLGALAPALPPGGPVLTSPAAAAMQTAAAIGGDAPLVDPCLRPCDYGRWRGQSLAAIFEHEPQAVAAWQRQADAAPHDGESLRDLLARVASWLGSRRDQGGTCLAVTHPEVVRAATLLALEAEPRSFWRIDAPPLTLARFSGHAGRWNLVSFAPLAP